MASGAPSGWCCDGMIGQGKLEITIGYLKKRETWRHLQLPGSCGVFEEKR